MEWQLPVQKLEIGNVNIGSPWGRSGRSDRGGSHQENGHTVTKAMAPLSYFGPQYRLPSVSILFPPLPIVEIVPGTGKLVLDMSETSLGSIKMSIFQETLINAIQYHQHGWFKSEFTKDEIRHGFQPLFQDNHLTFHCPLGSNTQAGRSVPIYKGGAWLPAGTQPDLKPGMRIRIAVKIHGISFLMQGDQAATAVNGQPRWTGRCRLQHRIQGILVQA
jgi:hypothetical protein